jgi:hypothetical protein
VKGWAGILMAHAPRGLWWVVLAMSLAISIDFLAFAGGQEDLSPLNRQRLMNRSRPQGAPPGNTQERRRRFDQLSPEEKARLRGRFQEWKSLPPAQRQDLRNRMDEWRKLPPQQQELFRQRFQQWKNLQPEEQLRYRQKLQQWESLSPQERDEIRRRFRSP